MTHSLENKILEALKAKPSQKADELAQSLGSSRAAINKIFYGPLREKFFQDRTYRWSLTAESPRMASVADESDEQTANTDLARLCRYYLACLSRTDAGISIFLTSKYGDPDYLDVPFIPRSSENLAEHDVVRRLLGRKRTERGRYGLYFGYPAYVSLQKSRKSNWQGYMVEPILLFPVEQDARGSRLTIDLSFAIINQKPLQAFTNVERDMLMDELVQLEQELGLNDKEDHAEIAAIDEIAMRLQAVRPEWPWKENIDPDVLNESRSPMAEIAAPGIYNRAVLLMAEKSPFTRGLEKELHDLARMRESDYANTSLGRWLKEAQVSSPAAPPTEPLLEVLPMNCEQRQAVSAALTRRVTVITGPPGTGKSQLVSNLLVNAAWSGKRILFASKNNKAVDVVELRVNGLGSRPILLRVGARAYQLHLAEYVLALLSSTTTNAEREEFADAKIAHERLLTDYASFSDEAQRFIDLRNDIDRREQIAEEARQHLGPDCFARALKCDIPAIQSDIQKLKVAIEQADREKASFWVWLLWPLLKSKRFAYLALAMEATSLSLRAINVVLPSPPLVDCDVQGIAAMLALATRNLDALEKTISYRAALKQLQESRSLEEIAREESRVLRHIARHSAVLWKLWLRLQPSTLSATERKKLSKYTALLKMVIEAGDEGQLSHQVYTKYSAMLRDISHLLPCWAVTSLSVRGRIPFEPGNFDLVVFDEASQCDIASALPLLYRAKSAVIIGDPHQLSHISGLRKGQDQALLERYKLLDNFPHWAYSHQSLFDLGAAQASGDDIVSLVDHHRSHADIIGFSNEEFYDERLRVATKYDNLRSPSFGEPGIRWVDVKGQVTRPANGSAVNFTEAKAVVATLRDLMLTKGYRGTVGVVTPFRAQANAITEAVNRDNVLASALVQRGFLADTVHKFQGDERDVMLFSPVVSVGKSGGALGFLHSNGKLFNVAITRARAQLIVVGDLSACSSCDVGHLSRFAAYSASLENQVKEAVESQFRDYNSAYPNVARPEIVSDWEKKFYVAAYQVGLRLIPQYSVEKYIIDFLMADGDRKLAIEIDGERYHRNWTGELCRRDQIRNQRLFELGYDVHRFWVYEVRDDLEACLCRLKEWQNKATHSSRKKIVK